MANRRRPLVRITRPVPPTDRYELRNVDTEQVVASIRVTTANPLSHVDAICDLAQFAASRVDERMRARVGLTCPPMLSDGGPS